MTEAALLLAQAGDPHMGAGSWTFMLLAWISVTWLAAFCFRRVLGGGRRKP